MESTASQNASGLKVPSGISDSSGNPLFYTDGEDVFDANGDILPNGDFSVSKEESLVHPDPYNSNRYYIVRSGSNGTDYSVVDMDLNGGLGDIVEDEKEVFISQDYARLISTSNATDTGRWLILISNGGISELFITIYEALPGGGFDLDAENAFTYTFAGWEEFIDDAAITRDCDLLAMSFKGHYFVLFGFDNETGILTPYFDFAANTSDSFTAISRIELSPSGQYLYVMGENSVLSRFDISSLDQPTIVSTQESINDEMSSMTDIKLGPDDRLYILGNGSTRIDALDSIEGSVASIEYEAAVFEQAFGGNYFPNTPNIYCGLAAPFFNLSPLEICLGEEVTLDLGYNFQPDSLLWDLGIEVGDENLLESLNPTLEYPEPGSYPVSAGIWLDSVFYSIESSVTVYEYPEIDLGEDQTICEGEELVLDPGIADSYLWNTGSEDSSLVVTESGIYSVEAANGPCAVNDDIQVTVIPQINPNLGQDVTLCDESEYMITSSVQGQWSTDETGSSITVQETGFYSVTASNECFTSTDSIEIIFIDVPEPQLPEALTACLGSEIMLNPQIDADSFLWSTGEESSSIEVSTSGFYSVSMNYRGCLVEDEVTVAFEEYIPVESLIVPNIFSPNGDMLNDVFRLSNSVLPDEDPCEFPGMSLEVKIFNRWGNLIHDGNCEWDGRNAAGNVVSEGTYYYLIDAAAVCFGQTETKTIDGSLELVR
ncbi:T9SS type B sorting domain-containing protein [Halocola ammonii]